MKAQLELLQHAGDAKPADQRVALTWFARMRQAADAAPAPDRLTHNDRATPTELHGVFRLKTDN